MRRAKKTDPRRALQFQGWMEAETSWGLTESPVADHYARLEEGVARGDPSFQSIALTHLHRATLFAEDINQNGDPMALQFVQALGKAAHSLIAMRATAISYHAGKGALLSTGMDSFARLAAELKDDLLIWPNHLAVTQKDRVKTFDTLQRLQDFHDMRTFDVLAVQEAQLAANQFAAATRIHGWPEPGRPDGDAQLWSGFEADEFLTERGLA
jgi:hypothetical protein